MRVVSYRYGLTGARFDEVWEFTSADGGATFDAGHPVGIAPFDEAVRGPGDTLTVATNAESTGLAVQNVPLDGSTAGTSQAILSADHPYNGTVGLAGAATASRSSPTARATRRSPRAGALNDAATWTPPVDIGYADYPRLAGGPSGLFLLSGTVANTLTVRKFDGTTFDAGVKIADHADDAQAHLAEDPAGRLHAVFAHNTAAGCELDYATSDNGAQLAVGAAADPDRRAQGIGQLRAAAAADHIGVAAWETSSGAESEIRVVGIGPTGGASPPVPGKSVVVGVVSGQVFVTSRGGQAHAPDRRGEHPRRRPGRHPQGPRPADLGGERQRPATQTADFYQGAFKVKQACPRATGRPR